MAKHFIGKWFMKLVITNLIGATVPDSGNGQAEEDPRPRLIRVVDRSEQMERVRRWNAAVVQSMVLLLHPVADRRVRNSMKELMRHRLETTDLDETCQYKISLTVIVRLKYLGWQRLGRL